MVVLYGGINLQRSPLQARTVLANLDYQRVFSPQFFVVLVAALAAAWYFIGGLPFGDHDEYGKTA